MTIFLYQLENDKEMEKSRIELELLWCKHSILPLYYFPYLCVLRTFYSWFIEGRAYKTVARTTTTIMLLFYLIYTSGINLWEAVR